VKKIIVFVSGILSVLCLTSCLREVKTNEQTAKSTEETTAKMTESATKETFPVQTEPFMPQEPAPLHKDVLKWTSQYTNSDILIMTESEIEAENARMLKDCTSLVDILEFGDKVTAEKLRLLIAKNAIPSEVRYDSDGSEIPDSHREQINGRMKVEAEGELQVMRGVMTKRGNLRAIPDDKPYRKSPDNMYDSVQLTELPVGTPVLVLYSTSDDEYYFVVSQIYNGWVKKTDVAITEDEGLWNCFTDPESFICITDALYKNGAVKLDMGSTLPLISVGEREYSVEYPIRTSGGFLDVATVRIPLTSASRGYLPYTYENYLIQAFKYENTEYGWGGLDDGIDCSGFVSNVFACFGFEFPRDTKDQDKTVGSALAVKGKNHSAIAERLVDGVPTAVYFPGHTLLYIGYDSSDGKYYFIHAPQIGEKVSVTYKEDLSGMTYIGRVGDPTKY